jgi:hypothetical protein
VSLLLIDNIAAFYWLDKAVREGPPGPGGRGPDPTTSFSRIPPVGPGGPPVPVVPFPPLDDPPGDGTPGPPHVATTDAGIPVREPPSARAPAGYLRELEGPEDRRWGGDRGAPLGLHQVCRAVAEGLRKVVREHKLAVIVSQHSFLPPFPNPSTGWVSLLP